MHSVRARFYLSRRMKSSTFAVGMLALFLVACDRSPFPGYSRVSDAVYFKLYALGEGERIRTDSDSALLRIRVARFGDQPGSLFSTERWYPGTDSVFALGVRALAQLRAGDSIGLVIRGDRAPWHDLGASKPAGIDTTWVAVELSLRELRSPQESRRIVQQQLMARTASDEASILDRYLTGSPIVWKEYMGVRYALDPANPKGAPVRSGEVATISYAAHFLDSGALFDDTGRAGQPLTFRLGDPGQVIKGLEVAVHLLPKGGRGQFIIPSDLAFGAEGSSSGIVPPFTPVLYSVEVIEAGVDSVARAVVDTAATP